MDNWVGEYGCDGGSLMVHNSNLGFRIPNGIGDGTFKVTVDYRNNWTEPVTGAKFVQTFIVREGEFTYISDYDLEFNETYKLMSGFYAAYSNDGDMYIVWHDLN